MRNDYDFNLGYISHHGILGQKWGIRRYQNPDGTLTAKGKAHTKSNRHGIIVNSYKADVKSYINSVRHPIRTEKGNLTIGLQSLKHPVQSLKIYGKGAKNELNLLTSKDFRKRWNNALQQHYIDDPRGNSIRTGRDYIKELGDMSIEEIMNDHDAFVVYRELMNS